LLCGWRLASAHAGGLCCGPASTMPRPVERITHLPPDGEPATAVLDWPWHGDAGVRVSKRKGSSRARTELPRFVVGLWWCAATKRHVTFESWVECEFLLSADHDRRSWKSRPSPSAWTTCLLRVRNARTRRIFSCAAATAKVWSWTCVPTRWSRPRTRNPSKRRPGCVSTSAGRIAGSVSCHGYTRHRRAAPDHGTLGGHAQGSVG